jgi:single-strand DNA-binding protein
MSLFILASGSLISAPQRRTSAAGKDFATATLRVSVDGGDVMLVSTVAFGAQAEELLRHQHGEALSISGRARPNEWLGRDGEPHYGLQLVAEQIASASAARRADADRRRSSRTAVTAPRELPRHAVGHVGGGDGRPLPERLPEARR